MRKHNTKSPIHYYVEHNKMSNQKIKMVLNVINASDELAQAIACELTKPDDEKLLEQILNDEHTTDTTDMQANSASV